MGTTGQQGRDVLETINNLLKAKWSGKPTARIAAAELQSRWPWSCSGRPLLATYGGHKRGRI